jgi:hypothetical protein
MSQGGRTAASRTATNDMTMLEERVEMLESRLREIERRPRISERGRSMLDRVMPQDARRHFRVASRENLLAVRTMVDYWIGRIDETEEPSSRQPERETIEIR